MCCYEFTKIYLLKGTFKNSDNLSFSKISKVKKCNFTWHDTIKFSKRIWNSKNLGDKSSNQFRNFKCVVFVFGKKFQTRWCQDIHEKNEISKSLLSFFCVFVFIPFKVFAFLELLHQTCIVFKSPNGGRKNTEITNLPLLLVSPIFDCWNFVILLTKKNKKICNSNL